MKTFSSFKVHSLICIGLVVSVYSCSNLKQKNGNLKEQKLKQIYAFTDISGEFKIVREAGPAEKNGLYVKSVVLPVTGDTTRPLESYLTLSDYGLLKTKKGKIPILRPRLSTYTVWLEGQKYVTQMRLNLRDQALDVLVSGSEGTAAEKKSHKLPEGSLFCFFSQLVECLKAAQYFDLKSPFKDSISFSIIWDAWPHFQKQYPVIPNELITRASMGIEGREEDGTVKYRLDVGDQTLFYHLDENKSFKKMFWISQGISQIAIGGE